MATISVLDDEYPPPFGDGPLQPYGIGTGDELGFFGAARVPRQTVRAAATTNAQAIALANDLRAALIALGLVQ